PLTLLLLVSNEPGAPEAHRGCTDRVVPDRRPKAGPSFRSAGHNLPPGSSRQVETCPTGSWQLPDGPAMRRTHRRFFGRPIRAINRRGTNPTNDLGCHGLSSTRAARPAARAGSENGA